jgi:ribonucleoside-diphosphate reductase alpha chain
LRLYSSIDVINLKQQKQSGKTMNLSENAKFILKQRYLQRDENRDVIETPNQMFKRVAKAISEIEYKYGKDKAFVKQMEKDFLNIMVRLEFLPNSPTLMNAGTDLGQLSACFVLPVEDDIDEIFQAVAYTAKIHKSGGGTGFSFSRLRPKEDIVKSTGGVASGPISFMTVFDAATEVIKQGGKRRGANMGIMRVDHPDIMDFIMAKETEGVLHNFNLSVGITDQFMRAVEKDGDFEFINPRTKKPVKSIKARAIWNLLCLMSWKNGEPAVIFLDTINRANPTPEIGEIEATNPCGETPLLPYESCNLGSINLSKFIKKNGKVGFDYEKFEKAVAIAVRFLDDVVDVNKYPLPQIREATLANRKIGLGVMGWADLLIFMGIKYDSDEAIELADSIMRSMLSTAMRVSVALGKEKGNFPNILKSKFKSEQYMRNATLTTIAPTGTISLIANASSGIEPIFAVVQRRNVEETLGKNLVEVNPSVKRSLELKGLWTPDIEKALVDTQCKNCVVLPKEMKDVLRTSAEISPEWHLRMQAVFQKYTNNAVSKTINLPNNASINDIETIYIQAWKLGIKGTTVYRDNSRQYQLLVKEDGNCPTCPSD